jgi:AcrR family transcriptional regulator
VETIPGHLERLPAGGDRFQAELLARSPRERILAAMFEIVAERGYQATTIEHIVKKAGISRATFYENFENREHCLLAGFAEAEKELRRRIATATGRVEDWPSRIRAALEAFLGCCAEQPAIARTCLVEALTVGPVAIEPYEWALTSFAPLFAEGREHSDGAAELPGDLEDLIIGGLLSMVHRRLLRDEIAEIPKLLPAMLGLALLPYLGEQRTANFLAGQG